MPRRCRWRPTFKQNRGSALVPAAQTAIKLETCHAPTPPVPRLPAPCSRLPVRLRAARGQRRAGAGAAAPQEAGHAKNTARLLHLCLPGSRLEVGKSGMPPRCRPCCTHPGPARRRAPRYGRCCCTRRPRPIRSCPCSRPPALPPDWLAQPQTLRLVVLDGTWRKSRKMLYRNPGLQQLPRLALQDLPPGRYDIRKAQAPDQLSSFEAAALALARLHAWEAGHPAWAQLLQSFEAAMALHQRLQAAGRAPPGD
ncbi:DTW domain-containing protein [Comamonas aquatica]|uniref:DTW domain-containing protein n=1 Tax=Comamonas aquatica TaxID=225991 RepID=UPI001F298682|nr:DTW domain-containing protein [Comamonas aquatica]